MTGRAIVVGDGLFGCWAATVLADRGLRVVLVEQDEQLLSRASFVNQARLHTGLHYPRSLLTAREALASYRRFRAEFPEAVRDFRQVYAIARHGSKTSAAGFEQFIDRLGLHAEPVTVSDWFNPAVVAGAWSVEEPSFDATLLRAALIQRLAARPRISVLTGIPVETAWASSESVGIRLADGTEHAADELVIATYAGINPLREGLGIAPLPLLHELTEVVLGRVGSRLAGRGFTVMGGPFWSIMPFGTTDLVTLTSVGLTPVARSGATPTFPCQASSATCTPLALDDCTRCAARPASLARHQVQQMSLFLRDADDFVPERSLWTVKTVLRIAEVDDARPTFVRREADVPVWTVFSGKVSTVFDLESELS